MAEAETAMEKLQTQLDKAYDSYYKTQTELDEM